MENAFGKSPSEERESKKVAVFVAWPYANGPRHIGHGASLLPGDILARYHRSVGDDVLMVSGTDEFGTPNVIAAEKADQSPEEFVTQINEVIRQDFTELGMSFDWFTRTTSPEHITNAQHLFSELVAAEYIEKGTMLGAFDSQTNQALPDRYVEGTCPFCGATSRGDQCDNCSNLLEPKDLIKPVSKITGNEVLLKDTEHYFLMLDKLSGELMEWLNKTDALRPNAKAFSIDRASELRPRAITRDMSWGVPLPKGFELEGDNEKVLYVWFEAVIGYVSASMEWAKEQGDPERWKEWWQDNYSRHFYAMGKDNVPFHTMIWPSMIIGANHTNYTDGQLHQPDVIASTENLNFNDSKLSTSRNNVAYIRDLLAIVSPDALRFYLVAAGPETKDVNFSFHELARRVNDELIAKWGNLVSRSVSLIAKNHNGRIPDIAPQQLGDTEHELLSEIAHTYDTVGKHISEAKFSSALKQVLDASSIVNKYIYENEPWKQAKIDPASAETTMYTVMTAIQNINVMMSPFIPHASQKVHEIFNNTDSLASQPYSLPLDENPDFSVLTGDYSSNTNRWHFTYATPNTPISGAAKHLFEKLDSTELEQAFQTITANRALGKAAVSPLKPNDSSL